MKYLLHLYFITFLILMLSGCVPNAAAYYRPSVQGGELIPGRCVPLEEEIKFHVGDLKVLADTFVGVDNQLFVSLRLIPRKDQKVYFTSDDFIVHDLDNSIKTNIEKVHVTRIDRVKSVTIPFPSTEVKLSLLGLLDFAIYLPIEKYKSFEIISPKIKINESEYEFPSIRFEKKLWVGTSPFNC